MDFVSKKWLTCKVPWETIRRACIVLMHSLSER